jgi:hypothetical protein
LELFEGGVQIGFITLKKIFLNRVQSFYFEFNVGRRHGVVSCGKTQTRHHFFKDDLKQCIVSNGKSQTRYNFFKDDP